MAFIGNTNTTQAFTPAVDFFNGNGSTTAFTLSRQVASVAQVQAVISNVPQKPGDAFTVSGNTITFTSAPPSGTQNIYVYYTSPITQVIAPGQGTVGTAQIQNGAVIPADLSTGAPTWNSAGSLGLGGLTPSAYGGSYYGLQLGRYGLMSTLASGATDGYTTSNAYYDGSSWKYIVDGSAAYYGVSSSAIHSLLSAGVGTAGNNITFTTVANVGKDITFALQGASSVAGTGITFPATQSASSNANTLDDYEEGDWSPNVGGNATYAAQFGKYVKVGRLVTCSFDFTISVIGTGSTATLFGFPFTNGLGAPTTGCVSYYSGLSVSPTFIAFYIGTGNAQAPFVWNTTGGSTVQNNGGNLFQNGSRVIGQISYYASS